MDVLFSTEFSHNQETHIFIIHQISDNLFQAKSPSQIIMLWKIKESWEGVTNNDEPAFIEYIGAAIDKHFSTSNIV
jgi:hypothetical protein